MAWTRCIQFLLCLYTCVYANDRVNYENENSIYHNEFAVHIPSGARVADEVALKYEYDNIGQIGALDNFFLFRHRRLHKRSVSPAHSHRKQLSADPQVAWVEQQIEKHRVKRDRIDHLSAEGVYDLSDVSSEGFVRERRQFFPSPFTNGFGRFSFFKPPAPNVQPIRRRSERFPDPFFKFQWYLSEGAVGNYDMNVTAAWNSGHTGKGVVVSILDDGIQHNHPDLAQNYDPRASTDINDNDSDPMPRNNGDNKHGTRCAGEVASVAFNNYCGVGIAYNASIGGVRMLDGTVNDAVEARAISLNPDYVDIYSASWGPEDDGKTVDGPGPLAKRAFINGVIRGRHGKGSIFVWASGNGGRHTDNCNCDGYTNSIFTLSISSASQRGLKPWYLEECSSTLASTYSSGTPSLDRSVATADMDGELRPDRICTLDHTGTSASAPLAAGICALALEANPDLTWRDMQHIVVRTSRRNPLRDEEGWFVNAVGRSVSHKFGYGLMDAGGMVTLAKQWKRVPPQHVCQTIINRTDLTIPTIRGSFVQAEITTDGCAGTSGEVRYLEHVQAVVSLRFLPRGNINIKLISPSGTSSTLLFERPRDVLSEKFDDWPFLSVHFWGEKAAGTWKLIVTNGGSRQSSHPGVVAHWQLILHGTKENPEQLRFAASNFSPLSPTFNQFGDLIFSGSVPHRVYEAYTEMPDAASRKEFEIKPQMDVGNFSSFDSGVCHSECLGGCSGSGPQSCKDCRHFSLLGECVNTCPEGSFGSEENECMPCHGSCAQCIGPRQNQCSACPPNSLFVPHMGMCVETCPKGYFAESGSCLSCSPQCAECVSADLCSSCDHNLLLFNGTCHVACPRGTYEGNLNTCENCDPSCETCVGSNVYDCATCRKPFFMSHGRCVLTCPRGTYRDRKTELCLPCPMGCSSCDGVVCTSCDDGWRLKSTFCVALRPRECKINEYEIDGKCQACHNSCLNCVGPNSTQCLYCRSPSLLLNAQCVSVCPSGHFAQKSQCLPCPRGCSSCQSLTQCSSCEFKFHLHKERCLSSCPEGLYSDRSRCVPCDSSCATCWGPQREHCFSCPQNSVLLRDACKKSCPEGFFQDGGSCLPCYHNCRTCNGLGLHSCTSCHEYMTLDGGMCLECSAGRYYNSSERACAPCDDTCLTCNGRGANSCTSCQAPFSLHPETRSCRSCCAQDTFDEDVHRCCHCNPDTGQCVGSVTTDKRRIALSLLSSEANPPSGLMASTSAIVLLIGLLSTVIFGVGVVVYQSKSSSKRRRRGSNSYSYKLLQKSSSGSLGTSRYTTSRLPVSLSLQPVSEAESDDDLEEERSLFKRT